MSLEIMRQAHVEANYGPVTGKSPIPSLVLTFNNKYQHTFEPETNEGKLILQFDLLDIAKMFSGGTFVFFEGKLRDYRGPDYRGFIQSDDSIEHLMDTIGVMDYKVRQSVNGLINRTRARQNNGLFMGGEWDKFDLDIAELGQGGAFSNSLVYQYSVFSPNIVTTLETLRLVCTNGMVSKSALASYEVPVISDWEDNLNTITNRIKPELTELMRQRFISMAQQRASVRDIMLTHKAVEERLKTVKQADEVSRLEALMSVTNAERNLAMYYDEKVFKGTRGRFVEGDLTQFDVYNILTEASSHSDGTDDSDLKMQRLANHLMFESINQGVEVMPSIPKTLDSDPSRAFFGDN
jgi:hypothetical protein